MVNRGWEDNEARPCFVLHPGGPLLVAVVGEGYSKMDLVCSPYQSYHSRNLHHWNASWHHRILAQSWDWSFRLFCLKAMVFLSEAKTEVSLSQAWYQDLNFQRAGQWLPPHPQPGGFSGYVNLYHNKRISAYSSFCLHPGVHQVWNIAFQPSMRTSLIISGPTPRVQKSSAVELFLSFGLENNLDPYGLQMSSFYLNPTCLISVKR